MDFTFNVAIPHGDFYYDFFYQLSFIVGFLLFIYLGWKRKYPMDSWLLISVIASVFLIIGSKIGAYSLADWNQFFNTGNLPATSEKTMIGALFFGWIGVGVAQRLLRFRASILDVYVWVVPVAMIIQRLGCLLVGCCFGNPTWSNWGVCYSDEHHIFDYHFQEGFVGTAANFTPAVHPVPLYLILGFVLVIFILKKFQNRFRANGSLALFGLMLLFGVRFMVEFFRDPITNHGQGEILLGLKIIQWFVLGLIVFFSVLLFFREKNRQPQAIEIPNSAQNFKRNLWISFFLILVIALGKNWFTLPELQSIFVRVLLSYVALGLVFFKYFFKKQSVQWAVSICILSVFLMGQTYTEKDKEAAFQPHNTTQLSISTLTGKSDIDYVDQIYLGGGGCSGGSLVSADTIKIGPYYSGIGADYKIKHYYEKNRAILFHGYGMMGSYPKSLTPISGETSLQIVQSRAIGLLVGFEGKRMGLKLGGIFGKWGLIDSREKRFDSQVSLAVRFGRLQKIHLFSEVFYDEFHPASSLGSSFKMGLGFNGKKLGIKNDLRMRFRFGVAEVVGQGSVFLDGEIFLTDKIFITPSLRFGGNEQYGVGIGYEFN